MGKVMFSKKGYSLPSMYIHAPSKAVQGFWDAADIAVRGK